MRIQSFETRSSLSKNKDPGISYLFQLGGMEDIFYVNKNNITSKIATSYTLDYDMDDKKPSVSLDEVPEWATRWCLLHVFEGDHYNR
jgi:hypothetical protein